jgi:hypothetical protein
MEAREFKEFVPDSSRLAHLQQTYQLDPSIIAQNEEYIDNWEEGEYAAEYDGAALGENEEEFDQSFEYEQATGAWHEIRSFSENPASSLPNVITVTAFDDFHELLWTGLSSVTKTHFLF